MARAGQAGAADVSRGAGHHGTRRGRHPQELSGLQDRDGSGLQDGRVGAKPRDDQPHPVALARVKARKVGAYRGRAHIADDADLRWAPQQAPGTHGRPGHRGGPDLVRGDLSLSPVRQLGAGGEDEAQDVVGADGGTGRGGSRTPWPASNPRSWLVTSIPDHAGMSQTGPCKWRIRCSHSLRTPMTSSRAGSMTARSLAGSFVEDHPGCSQRAMPAGTTLPAAWRAARKRAGVPSKKRADTSRRWPCLSWRSAASGMRPARWLASAAAIWPRGGSMRPNETSGKPWRSSRGSGRPEPSS